MSTDVKLSKAQISKIIQSRGSFASWLGNLGNKALTNIDILLARDYLPGLVSNLTSNAINKFERKISGKGAVRAGERETVKHEIKKQEDGILGALLAPLASSLVQPVISSVLKGISGRGVRRTGRGYMNKNF